MSEEEEEGRWKRARRGGVDDEHRSSAFGAKTEPNASPLSQHVERGRKENRSGSKGDEEEGPLRKKSKKNGSAATAASLGGIGWAAVLSTAVDRPPAEQNVNHRPSRSSHPPRPSPFRIRVGCVVALRSHRTEYPGVALVPATSLPTNSGGGGPARGAATLLNPEEDGRQWVRAWTDPVPGRDGGLNLVGRRVRVQVPLVRPGQDRTVLEGEVVRLLEQGESGRNPHRPLKVELLVDSRQCGHFPFLKKVDDPMPEPGGTSATPASPDPKQRHRLQKQHELRIRGRGTAVVVVKLAPALAVLAFGSSSSSSTGASASSYFGTTRLPVAGVKGGGEGEGVNGAASVYRDNASKAASVGLAWAVQRTVPSKLWWEAPPRSQPKDPPPRHEAEQPAPDPGKEKRPAESRGSPEEHVSSLATAGAAQSYGGTSGVQSVERNGKSGANRHDEAKQKVNSSAEVKATGGRRKGTQGGKKGTSAAAAVGVRHVGDGADQPERQVQNWRWLAGRYHDLLLQSSTVRNAVTSWRENFLGQILSGGLIGEVVSIVRTVGDDAQNSLARVYIRRLVLPEHTIHGRLPHHTGFDVFDDGDGLGRILKQLVSPDLSSIEGSVDPCVDIVLLEVPIEHLVIISRKVHRSSGESKLDASPVHQSTFDLLQLTHSYSFREDAYRSLSSEPSCPRLQTVGCWRETVAIRSKLHEDVIYSVDRARAVTSVPPESGSVRAGSPFASTLAAVSTLSEPVEFELPSNFIDFSMLPKPQLQPITKVVSRASPVTRSGIDKPKKASKSVAGNNNAGSKMNIDRSSCATAELVADISPVEIAPIEPPSKVEEDYTVFKPTCSRLVAYDCSRNRREATSSSSLPDRPRNLRQYWRELNRRDIDSNIKADDRSKSRADRASQRRMLKDAAASSSWLMGVDTLARREPHLRFDRSGIHSWGVYADEDIAAEEMIIEYRGELIENAIAEKREKEYSDAKIGSDYMFRIDAYLVCDATKQGNVARFINASCDPNCYTKIITLDGNKRIVIYAKRDIPAGEELCYDYKFPLEYDESKRIPCHCGSKDCRGYMNWDKRYVALEDVLSHSDPLVLPVPTAQPPAHLHRPKPDQVKVRDVSYGSCTPSPPSNGELPTGK